MAEPRKPFFRRFTKKFFVVSNIILALIFVPACYGGELNPSGWWFMGLLNLAMPFILLLLILSVIFWLLVRPRWSLLSILTIAICWGRITNVIPFNFSGSFQIQKENGRLRVLSWNVEHFNIKNNKTAPEVKQQMLALINQYKPDVACFQEMVGSDSSDAINSMEAIKTQLGFSDYFYSFDKRFDYDQRHHFGIVTFSRFPIINHKTIAEYPHDYNSIFQYLDVIYYQDTVRVFNVHLQSLKFDEKNLNYLDNPSVKTDSTITESKSIIKKLKIGFQKRGIQARHVHEQVLLSPYPVIVCGDFNDVPNSYAYITIGRNLQNAFAEKGDGLGRTYMSISPTLRIDNIFADKAFKIEQFTRIRKKLSDHFPLFSDLVLRKNIQ